MCMCGSLTLCYSDPWSAHLWGENYYWIPYESDKRSLPLMCPRFCQQFYNVCGSVYMNPQASPVGVGQISKSLCILWCGVLLCARIVLAFVMRMCSFVLYVVCVSRVLLSACHAVCVSVRSMTRSV